MRRLRPGVAQVSNHCAAFLIDTARDTFTSLGMEPDNDSTLVFIED